MERVIRNRKAASASRERKRQEAEALALRNKELEAQLALLQQRNSQLERELRVARPEFGGVSSPSNESVTFSQELFPPQLSNLSNMSQSSLDLLNDLLNSKPEQQGPKTVDPTTISPALSPVPEEPEFDDAAIQEKPAPQAAEPSKPLETIQTTTSNHPSTQYPAAVLWHDLQCQRPVEAALWMSTALQNHLTSVLLMLQMASSLSTTFLSLWARHSSTLSRSQASSKTTQTSWLPPPPPTALISIIMAVTSPCTSPSSSTSTSTPYNNQATAQPTPSHSSTKTLRLRTLRKLLTCNRQLARPLQDATLEVLRLSLAKGNGAEQVIAQELAAGQSVAPALLRQVADGKWPSTERLISLLWAIRSLERRIKLREQGVQDVKRSSIKAPARLARPRGRRWDTK